MEVGNNLQGSDEAAASGWRTAPVGDGPGAVMANSV